MFWSANDFSRKGHLEFIRWIRRGGINAYTLDYTIKLAYQNDQSLQRRGNICSVKNRPENRYLFIEIVALFFLIPWRQIYTVAEHFPLFCLFNERATFPIDFTYANKFWIENNVSRRIFFSLYHWLAFIKKITFRFALATICRSLFFLFFFVDD